MPWILTVLEVGFGFQNFQEIEKINKILSASSVWSQNLFRNKFGSPELQCPKWPLQQVQATLFPNFWDEWSSIPSLGFLIKKPKRRHTFRKVALLEKKMEPKFVKRKVKSQKQNPFDGSVRWGPCKATEASYESLDPVNRGDWQGKVLNSMPLRGIEKKKNKHSNACQMVSWGHSCWVMCGSGCVKALGWGCFLAHPQNCRVHCRAPAGDSTRLGPSSRFGYVSEIGWVAIIWPRCPWGATIGASAYDGTAPHDLGIKHLRLLRTLCEASSEGTVELWIRSNNQEDKISNGKKQKITQLATQIHS